MSAHAHERWFIGGSRTWTRPDAIELLVFMQKFAHHAGYHLGLAGGVLNRGQSAHDLDIVVMPLATDQPKNLPGLFRAFREFAGCSDVREISDGYPMEAGRTVWRGRIGAKKVDFFVYQQLPVRERLKRWLRSSFRHLFAAGPEVSV